MLPYAPFLGEVRLVGSPFRVAQTFSPTAPAPAAPKVDTLPSWAVIAGVSILALGFAALITYDPKRREIFGKRWWWL